MDLFFSEVIVLVTSTSFVGAMKKESIGLSVAEVVCLYDVGKSGN